MRIIAGRFKGLRLASPRIKGVRPTLDRVREALFSTLGPAVEGSRILDLFAGTGAFGFEALSRGARYVAFVDKDRRVAETLKANTESLGLGHQIRIINADVPTALKRLVQQAERFHVVFLDPPYESEWVEKIVFQSALIDVLEPGCLLVIERDSKAPPLEAPSGFDKRFSRKYGGTLIEIFEFRDSR